MEALQNIMGFIIAASVRKRYNKSVDHVKYKRMNSAGGRYSAAAEEQRAIREVRSLWLYKMIFHRAPS